MASKRTATDIRPPPAPFPPIGEETAREGVGNPSSRRLRRRLPRSRPLQRWWWYPLVAAVHPPRENYRARMMLDTGVKMQVCCCSSLPSLASPVRKRMIHYRRPIQQCVRLRIIGTPIWRVGRVGIGAAAAAMAKTAAVMSFAGTRLCSPSSRPIESPVGAAVAMATARAPLPVRRLRLRRGGSTKKTGNSAGRRRKRKATTTTKQRDQTLMVSTMTELRFLPHYTTHTVRVLGAAVVLAPTPRQHWTLRRLRFPFSLASPFASH